MADNITLNPGTGGDVIATDELTTQNGSAVSGVKVQRMKVGFGSDGDLRDVDPSNPLPITGAVTVSGVATTAGQAAIIAALGNPLQAGGSIGNTAFGISGTLPAFANPPTVNLGTLNGAATAAAQATGNTSLASIDADLGLQADAAASSDTGTFSLIALFKRLLTKLPALTTANPGAADPAVTVAQRPVQIWTASFADVGSGLLSPLFTQRRLGTGFTVSQSAGSLLVAAGTTANAEFLARSTATFNGAFINRLRATLSQRIVNNNFAVMLADRIGEGLAYNCTGATVVDVTLTAHGFTAANVGQFMNLGGLNVASGTGVPGRYAIASIPNADTIRFTVAGWATGTGTLDLFGWNYYRALYTGTGATNVAVDAQRNGWATGDTNASINTTASPGHVLSLAVDGRSAYWADTLAASSTTPTVTTRASRFENLPEPDVPLFVYIWAFNGTANPASSTTFTLGFVSVEDTVNNPVYLAGVRQLGQAAPLSVVLGPSGATVGTVNLAAGVQSVGNLTRANPFTDSSTVLAANATFTGTGRATTGANYPFFNAMAFADQAGTLFIDQSVDSGTTYRQIASVALAAGTAQPLSVRVTGAAGTATLYRVRYTNGATLQAAFQLTSSYTAA